MKRPDVSVVVVHHRGHEQLFEALAALEEACRGRVSAEIVVVDNASGLPVGELLRRHPTARRVAAPANVGFAAGCRLGAEAARSPTLLLVNDDAVVDREAPLLLAQALERADADVVAVAGRLTDRTGERNDFSGGFLTFDGHAFQNDVGADVALLSESPGEEKLFACGGLMAVRRPDFLSSGGFDDDYFAYLEDVDFGWRQWIFGRRIVAEPRAFARHRGGATGEALGVYSRGYLFEKNAFATAYKNFDAEHFAALMPSVLAAFLFRVSEMLATRNPGAEDLGRDPYAAAPPTEAGLARRLLGIADSPAVAPRLDDPLTAAHLRALLWIRRNRESLAAKRRIVQAGRRRPDAEIFARFPLRIVPTYPGDQGFDSDFFREFLAGAPRLVRTTLDEIFVGGAA